MHLASAQRQGLVAVEIKVDCHGLADGFGTS